MTRLGIPAPAVLAFGGKCVIEIEDNVGLSASAVYAALALSRTYGNYNRRMLVIEIIIARSLKTVL